MFNRKHKQEKAKEETPEQDGATDALAAVREGQMAWRDALADPACAHLPLGEFLDAIPGLDHERAAQILSECFLSEVRTPATLGVHARFSLVNALESALAPTEVDFDLDEPDGIVAGKPSGKASTTLEPEQPAEPVAASPSPGQVPDPKQPADAHESDDLAAGATERVRDEADESEQADGVSKQDASSENPSDSDGDEADAEDAVAGERDGSAADKPESDGGELA